SCPRNRRGPRESEAWEGETFSARLLASCAVGKGPRSIRRNDAPNTMERCACSMLPASLTVAAVPCASPVKNMAPPPKNLVVSALSCIPCLSLRQKSRRLRALLLLPLQFIPSCGGIGPRTQPRRAWIRWQRSHLVTVQAPLSSPPPATPAVFARAERAHWRMTWPQRLARNARPPSAPPVGIIVYGLATAFAQALGLRVA